MSLLNRYQEFGRPEFDPATNMNLPDDGLEELKLDSYEDGYKAGWADSIKAQSAEQESALTQISRRLEDMAFTHAEAVLKVNAGMKPLLEKVTEVLLPDIAKKALCAHVLEQFDELIHTTAQEAIEIAVAPENLEHLQKLLEGRANTSMTFAAEPTLTSGQVYLRTNRSEREINIDAVQDGLNAALDAYYSQTQQEEIRNG